MAEAHMDAVSGLDRPATPESNIFEQFDVQRNEEPVSMKHRMKRFYFKYYCWLSYCFENGRSFKTYDALKAHRKSVHRLSEEENKILPNGKYIYEWVEKGKPRPYEVPVIPPRPSLREILSQNIPGSDGAEVQQLQAATPDSNIFLQFEARLQQTAPGQKTAPDLDYYCLLLPCFDEDIPPKCLRDFKNHRKNVHNISKEEDEKILPNGWEVRQWIQYGKHRPYKVPKKINYWAPKALSLQLQERPSHNEPGTLVAELQRVVMERNITPEPGYMPQLEDPTGSRSKAISHTNTGRDAQCSSEAAGELEPRDMSLPHSSCSVAATATGRVPRPGEDLNCSENFFNPSNTCHIVNNNSLGLVSNDEVTASTEYNHHGAQDFDTDQFLDFPDSDQDYSAELEDLRERNLFQDQLDLPPASADSNVFFQFDVRKDNKSGKLQFVCLLHGCHGSGDFYESLMILQHHRREVHESVELRILEDIPMVEIIKKWTLHGKPRPCTTLELETQQPTSAQLDQLDHENWLDVARVQNLQPATLDSNIFKQFDVLVHRETGLQPVYRLYCLVSQCFGKGKPTVNTRDLWRTLENWGKHRAKVHGTSEEENKSLPSCKEVSEWMNIGKLRPYAANSKPQPKKPSLRERLAQNEPGLSMQHLLQRATQNSNIFEQFDVQPKEDQVPGSRPDFDYFCLLSPCFEKELPATTLHLLKLHRNSVHNISEPENNNLSNGREIREWVEKGKQRPYEVPVFNDKPYSKENLSRNQWNLLKRHAYMPQREPGNDVEALPGAGSSATALDQPVSAESDVFFQFDFTEGADRKPQYFCLLPPCNGSRSLATRRSLRQHRKEVHKNLPLQKLPEQNIIDQWNSAGKPRPYTPEVQHRRASKRAKRTKDAECSREGAQRNLPHSSCSVSAATPESDPYATRPEEEDDDVIASIESSDRDWDDRAEDRADDRAEGIDDHTEHLNDAEMDWAMEALEALVSQENLVPGSTSMEAEETGMGADEVAPPPELMHTWNTFSEPCEGQSIGVGHDHLGENAQEYTVPRNLQGLLDILDEDEEEILGSTMNADEKEKLRSIEEELLRSMSNADKEQIFWSTRNPDEEEILRSTELSNWEANDFQSTQMNILYHSPGY